MKKTKQFSKHYFHCSVILHIEQTKIPLFDDHVTESLKLILNKTLKQMQWTQ